MLVSLQKFISPQTEVVIILILQRADHTCVTKNQRWGAGAVNLSNRLFPDTVYLMLLGIWRIKVKQEFVLTYNYLIVRNFHGAKFSLIGLKAKFHENNFCEWPCHPISHLDNAKFRQKFLHKFCSAKNCDIQYLLYMYNS